jgi:hypothetical protein
MADKTDWLGMDMAQRGAPSSESRVDAEVRSRAQTAGNDSAQREGQWVPLADTTDENVPLTKDDLDAMVRNFQPKSVADHIPVRFGRANSDGPVVANISALRREGAMLSGTLVRRDPRFDQLLKSKKLGGRTARSLRFGRTPENGAALTGYGFHAPKVFYAGGAHEGDATDAALTKLASADSAGEFVQFSASDAGRVELIITENAMKHSGTHGSTARQAATVRGPHVDENSVKLNDLAVKHQRENKVSFSESLAAVAAAHPALTVPGWVHPAEQHSETFRFQTNSERLNELAGLRQREDRTLSFGECLSQCAAENPRLTLPDGLISFEEETPKSNGQQLSALAYKRAREEHISFGEALSKCAVEHPELTRPDVR